MSLFPKFNLRNTSNLSNPKQWLIDMWGGGSVSESGVTVTEETMMTDSGVWCGINFIASNLASLPCPVYKTDGNSKEKDKALNLYRILNTQANPYMTAMIYRETILYYFLLWNVSYSLKIFDKLGRLIELWPIHPDNVEQDINVETGTIQYRVTYSNGTQKTYQRKDILHIPGLGNGLSGLRIAQYSKDSIGLVLALRSYANLFFSNGANMGTILEHPSELGETAYNRLKASANTVLSGLGKSHKLFIAEDGMKVVKNGSDPEQSQLTESRKFAIPEVARWLNLPPHVLKDLENATYSNIEQQGIELVKYSFRPILVRHEQSYFSYLLTSKEQFNHTIKHNVDGLLRGDTAARGELYKTLFMASSITPNEIRALEDMNPDSSPLSDQTWSQLNMVPSSQAEKMAEEDPTEEPFVRSVENRTLIEARSLNSIDTGRKRVMKRFAPIFLEISQKIVNRESIAVKRELKKQEPGISSVNFLTWVDEFYRKFPKYIKDISANSIRTYSEIMDETISSEIDVERGTNDDLSRDIEAYIDEFANEHVERSVGQIRQQLGITGAEESRDIQDYINDYPENYILRADEPEEPEDLEPDYEAVDLRMDEWHEKRPEKMELEQTRNISGMVAFSTILFNKRSLVWRIRGAKTCPFCTQQEGKKLTKRNQSFVSAGTEINTEGRTPLTPYKNIKWPQLHRGCDCLAVAG